MHKDIGQRSRDSIKLRQVHRRYLAVYTGKVTEKEYLIGLKRQLHNGVLTLKYGKNLQECVQIALDEGENAVRQGDPFDEIFIIDDVDEKSREQIGILCLPLKRSSLPVTLLFSNPCIEVWLLCYGSRITSAAGTIKGAQRLARQADLIGGHHDKHIVVSLLNHDMAIKMARQLKATYGDDVLTCAPTTDMDLLVEKLLDEIKK